MNSKDRNAKGVESLRRDFPNFIQDFLSIGLGNCTGRNGKSGKAIKKNIGKFQITPLKPNAGKLLAAGSWENKDETWEVQI